MNNIEATNHGNKRRRVDTEPPNRRNVEQQEGEDVASKGQGLMHRSGTIADVQSVQVDMADSPADGENGKAAGAEKNSRKENDVGGNETGIESSFSR